MEQVNVRELVDRLSSPQDGLRKKAAFGLQSHIGDPSFADVFIAEGGLVRLRLLVLESNGNTLAYSLTSFSKLLEVDKGWDYVNQELVERVVELVVTHPLVNILRGAMSILVAIVSHSQHGSSSEHIASPLGTFGFRALKPALAVYPEFLEMLVSRLSSADHALCANALQLINSLMRDAMTDESDLEWPKFIRRLQDLGVIKAVYILMQSSALQDLAHPLLEFQALTKVLLRKWRDVPVDQEKPEHRRALKGLHLASNPEKHDKTDTAPDGGKKSRHNPEKWRRLGFDTESPASEFDDVGFLGMMDLTDYVRRHEDGYQKLLLEQATRPSEQRCPIAKASLAVTLILYDHFEVDKSDVEDAKSYLVLESRSSLEHAFRPLLLQWSRLHTAGLQAFLRLWKSTGAQIDDFEKVEDLVRILIDHVLGQAGRTKDVREVEDELSEVDHSRLRALQMELLEQAYEHAWGHHLRQVREELKHEAFQFVREQRIRCLLRGHWFPRSMEYKSDRGGPVTKQDLKRPSASSWRYMRLSHNRRYLHYADFDTKGEDEPGLEVLHEKLDLSTITSITSPLLNLKAQTNNSTTSISSGWSDSALLTPPATSAMLPTFKISIYGVPSSSSPNNKAHRPHQGAKDTLDPSEPISGDPNANRNGTGNNNNNDMQQILMTIFPQSKILAAEWYDGLNMLLHHLYPHHLLPVSSASITSHPSSSHNNNPHTGRGGEVVDGGSRPKVAREGDAEREREGIEEEDKGEIKLTSETKKLIHLISEYGLKIRLLNVRFENDGGGEVVGLGYISRDGQYQHQQQHGGSGGGGAGGAGTMGINMMTRGMNTTPPVPSREGVDDDFWYDVWGA